DYQPGNYQRSEWSVVVSNWQVTGTNLTYHLPGLGSRRLEIGPGAARPPGVGSQGPADEVVYTGSWVEERGNYSGGSVAHTTTLNDKVVCTYAATATHSLYLGTRYSDNGGQISIQVDLGATLSVNLKLPKDDLLVRIPLGQYTAGAHVVT